jgi:hypothetical protein
MASPVMYYLAHGKVQEWMIYRFIIGHLAATNAFLMLSIAILTRLMVRLTIARQYDRHSFTPLEKAFLSRLFWLFPAGLLAAGTCLAFPGLVGGHSAGLTSEHWSRIMAMSFFYLVAAILVSARVVAYLLNLIAEQLAHSRTERSAGTLIHSA